MKFSRLKPVQTGFLFKLHKPGAGVYFDTVQGGVYSAASSTRSRDRRQQQRKHFTSRHPRGVCETTNWPAARDESVVKPTKTGSSIGEDFYGGVPFFLKTNVLPVLSLFFPLAFLSSAKVAEAGMKGEISYLDAPDAWL